MKNILTYVILSTLAFAQEKVNEITSIADIKNAGAKPKDNKQPIKKLGEKQKVYYEFKVTKETKTWQDASNSCMMWGGSLVTLESEIQTKEVQE